MAKSATPSDAAIAVLRLLKERHNVLISGPPGTGKTRLLSEVAQLFRGGPGGPVHVPGAPIPIPSNPPVPPEEIWLPSPDRAERAVFRTVFHQNSKYRDFVTGLVPKVGTSGAAAFTVTQGTLYRASEFAKSEGAALLIVDEINRGPAIQIFGGSIAAIESDKRLNPDGSPHANTQPFELLGLDGETVEYSLPHDLYLLAAMNQADTSVEPLDVAFLRRWAPYRLEPAVSVLAAHLGVDLPLPSPLPTTPESAPDVYAAAIAAWEAVNRRISLGRGAEYQIGHGVMMLRDRPEGSSVSDALEYIDESWQLISSHIDEVFFGDTRGIAAVLNVGPESGSHPYRLEDVVFADEPRVEIVGPRPIPQGKLYALLRAIAGS